MKKKLHIFNFLYFTLLVFVMSSCEKEVKLDQSAVDQKLAVLCNFSPDEPFSIELSKSQSIFSGTIEDNIVDEADVSICVGTNLVEAIDGTTSSSDSGVKFESKIVVAEVKKIYTLKVKVDGVETITATSEIPDAVKISHASVGEINLLPTYFLDAEEEIQPYEVRLSLQFSDPSDQSDYYQVHFYQELKPIGASFNPDDTSKTIIAASSYPFIDESLVRNFNLTDGGVLFKDTNFDGVMKELVFQPEFEYDLDKYEPPTNIILELRSVSKEYYNYYTSISRQSSHENVPFSDPVIIFSNVENGYGIFAGYNKYQVKRAIEF